MNNFSRHSIFILLDIEAEEYTGKVIIENVRLYIFLNKTRGLNKEKYQEFMLSLLVKKEKLKLKPGDFWKERFFKLKEVEEVQEQASKGQDHFLNHYFANNFLKKNEITDNERNAIIAKLFEWKIAALIDDYSGNLRMARITKKED